MIARSITAACLAALAAGCTAVSFGGPLAPRPEGVPAGYVYLSTGGAPRPYQTLGFALVRGFSQQMAGFVEVGDARLDGTVHGALVKIARDLGGDGVIHIEFLDENPQTPADKARDLAKTISNVQNGRGEVESQTLKVRARGEIIRFTTPPPPADGPPPPGGPPSSPAPETPR